MMFRMLTDPCFKGVQAAAWIAAVVSAALPIIARPADGVVSADQIEQALAPAPRTRGLVVRPKAPVDVPKQAINLNIPFEFDSSALQQQATAQLKQLRAALTSPSLSKDQFMVAGHTDAKGSAQHNQQLSMRRAQAVKRFLVDNGVPAARLQTVGYGSEHLAVPDRPEDPANRRVEIRNLGEKP
jgi:outer membrane protein OmpA-like peptidoglycan-associated protein